MTFFYFRHQLKPNFWDENGTRVETVRIWDSPTWNREPLTLAGLQSVLQGMAGESSCLEVVCLRKDCPWKTLEDTTWIRFCRILKENLPNIKILHLHYPHAIGDEKCRILLEHLPSTLTHLELAFVKGDQPEILQGLGRNFPHLEELKILEYNDLSVEGGHLLAESVQKMSQLKKVCLRGFSSFNVKDSVKPVFDAIRSNSNLETVLINGVWYNYISVERKERVHWLPEEVEALQFGPRLNHVREEFLAGDSISVRDFVNALISVRDRVDCLDHVISGVDPNLYAKHAIGKTAGDLDTKRGERIS